MVVIAFAILYIVWGSTYFFIQQAVAYIPAFILGALRFLAAGILMMSWCYFRGEKLFDRKQIKRAAITGLLLLFAGNGAVIWSEQTLPSSLAAVLVASEALWFVLLDRPKWKENFSSTETLAGLLAGFIGVLLLFSESAAKAMSGAGGGAMISGFIILITGTISWAAGSLYAKRNTGGSAMVSAAWQFMFAGIAFLPASFINHEWAAFNWQAVPVNAWLSVAYLITMGSLAGYSAYVWLLQVRPVTQVATHVYVNPVVAVLLGVFFASEHLTTLQVAGLVVVLGSVLLVNLSKYRKKQGAAVVSGKVACSG